MSRSTRKTEDSHNPLTTLIFLLLLTYLFTGTTFDGFHPWLDMQDSEQQQAAAKLRNAYPTDLEDFADDFVQMKHFFPTHDAVKNPGVLLTRLVDLRDTFHNIIVALHICLLLPSSNAAGER